MADFAIILGMKAPSFAAFVNFINNWFTTTIEQIFNGMNACIFEQECVDLEHTYINGTKIEVCGKSRNSYVKTDHDATFMRVRKTIWEMTNLFRLTIFRQNESGGLICPNGKRFICKCDKHIY